MAPMDPPPPPLTDKPECHHTFATTRRWAISSMFATSLTTSLVCELQSVMYLETYAKLL